MQSTPTQLPDSALRRPPSRRISTPVSQRLQTITEGPQPLAAPPIPPKSVWRDSSSAFLISKTPWKSSGRSSSSRKASGDTWRTAPPAYGDWTAEPIVIDRAHLDNGPVEGEKLAALRRKGGHRHKERGGWRRVALFVAVVLLLIIGLAVGLGVGLTTGRKKHKTSENPSSSNSTDEGTRPFPLGQYSLLTSLKSISTECTSNAATWRCYPDTTFDSSNPTTSLATFNWIITNTSASYATVGTQSTPDGGIAANLSISSTDNPLAVTFQDQPLTYISSTSNSTSPRYTFSFTMDKQVIPSTSITSDNGATQCFYNQTTFTGTLYLSASRNYPSANATDQATNPQWPYAVEVIQSSPGGQDVPACYEQNNGALGARITTGFSPQSANAQCSCDYNNF